MGYQNVFSFAGKKKTRYWIASHVLEGFSGVRSIVEEVAFNASCNCSLT